MAKVKLSSVAEHVSGKVGDLVFYDKPGGTVLQAAPTKSDKPRSPKQLAGQDRFAQGAAYAKAALQDPRLRPVYWERYDRLKRQGKRNSLFSLAVQDHMNPPQVTAVSLFDY